LSVEVEREAQDQSTRDKALEALRERYCDIEDAPADHVAKEGDVAMVDIDGYLRDEDGNRAGELPIQGAVGGDDLELILEPGKFLPGVVEALIGKKAGEKVTVPVDFPESRQYREEQPLAGVKAGFDVTINAVRLRSLPELNDAFAGKIRPGLTLDELKQEVENTVGGQEEDKTTDTVHKELEKALAERLTSTLPSTSSRVREAALRRHARGDAQLRHGRRGPQADDLARGLPEVPEGRATEGRYRVKG
jgi:trigger factor